LPVNKAQNSKVDTSRKTGGGAATQAGISYQNRAAAWFCVRILAEQDVATLWQLPQDVTLEFIRCETEQPVDDIVVGNSQKAVAFMQGKDPVGISASSDSALGNTLGQFIKQFVAYQEVRTANRQPWERPLDDRIDLLVLVTSSRSPGHVTTQLPAVLSRLRNLTDSRAFSISGESHHCAHRDVADAKSSQITPKNRDRFGPRSGDDFTAFCELWRFERHLCCRTCILEDVCTSADVFALPCQRPETTATHTIAA
jgi:hypothetical protein